MSDWPKWQGVGPFWARFWEAPRAGVGPSVCATHKIDYLILIQYMDHLRGPMLARGPQLTHRLPEIVKSLLTIKSEILYTPRYTHILYIPYIFGYKSVNPASRVAHGVLHHEKREDVKNKCIY